MIEPDEPQEPYRFMVCRQCVCMSFDDEEIDKRYCKICKKTPAAEDDYFLAESSDPNAFVAFKSFILSIRESEP